MVFKRKFKARETEREREKERETRRKKKEKKRRIRSKGFLSRYLIQKTLYFSLIKAWHFVPFAAKAPSPGHDQK